MLEKSTVSILLLDDEQFMRKMMGRLLANLGFSQVTCCESGQAALDWLDRTQQPPDLILLDLNMPEMDGLEFARHLVERHYSGQIILVSGEDTRMLQAAEKLVRAHQLSVLGQLRKPVTPEALSALLDKWSLSAPTRRGAAKKVYGADELRAAIDNGELVNYYQPKVAVATGKVVGVETLVRWRHPQDGMVFPDQFIDVAETHGLIDDLTRVVLTGALAQAKRWQDAGWALRVAVNVSMLNLQALNFPDFVVELAAQAGVPQQKLVLELTESKLMGDLRAPLEILTRLRLKRVGLSIDDFGTGHSSLAQLRDIPFDELKIDRGFVHRAWTDET
ncbi:EAL domain-containing response regulator, partial [Roseateles sp. GG27B]